MMDEEVSRGVTAPAHALSGGQMETEKDYVFPAPTEDQKEQSHPGGDAVVRVVKVTYVKESKRFWIHQGQKTVHIGQHRVPMADGKFDMDRLVLELRRNGLLLLEEAFPEAGHYCEINDCWKRCADGQAFCTKSHEAAALAAHDRMYSFS